MVPPDVGTTKKLSCTPDGPCRSCTARRAARENNRLMAGSSDVAVIRPDNGATALEELGASMASGWSGKPANARGAVSLETKPPKEE